MNPVLVKIFATALALSQVTTQPDAVRTTFDPVQDQAEVTRVLQAGCAHIRKVFDIESINLDDLITTAMDDPQAMTGNIKALNGVSFDDLFKAYRQFCKNETVDKSPVDIGEVVTYFDKAAADLPDHTKLKDLRLPGLSVMLDDKGGRLAELGEPGRRRIWVPLSDIPVYVQKAFVAAEDKRFYQHHGVDERGMIRAFVGNLAKSKSGRPQGGSTITQQVVKNLVTGDDATYERKIREIILASRVEQTLPKSEILALYLNFIYLGRGSWGIEMASQSYFGKSASHLTLPEAAMLAGLTKGPSYFSPDRHPERARERQTYVLTRMQEDGVISASEAEAALAQTPQLVAYDPTRRDTGFYFADDVVHEAKAVAGIDALAAEAFTVHATVQPALQRATESALQDGLARYETRTGRARFQGPEANLSDAIQRIETERSTTGSVARNNAPSQPQQQPQPPETPAWQQALERTRAPLYDVHWTTAVVLAGQDGKNSGKNSDKNSDRNSDKNVVRAGLRDGRILPLSVPVDGARRKLKPYDLIFVKVFEGKGNASAKAELRVRPTVQGAAVVLENKTGRILAMAGGFSYPLSQLNRVTQARRQPGSTFKPVSYLAALKAGLQPNTLVQDEPITLPPIGNPINAREQDYWSPKNYDNGGSGVLTLRRALENSRNLVTAHLLDGAISSSPEDSLDRVCQIAQEAQLYKDCERYYPFVLGAQPVRMIDLAAFFAAIANEGARPTPYAIESIDKDNKTIYQHEAKSTLIGSADPAAFYQLKTMLQGVVERGTAYTIHNLSPYVAGKTGTTENENDAWFVGFTNDVTVAVWVGYDNADGQRRTLGVGETGAKTAIPIFEPIIAAVWAGYAPRAPLNPPSAEAKRQLVDLPIDLASGERLQPGMLQPGSGRPFMEHFHLGSDGQVEDTQYRLVSREEADTFREADMQGQDESVPGSYGSPDPPGSSFFNRDDGRYNPYPPSYQAPRRQPGGLFGFFFGQQQYGGNGNYGNNYDGPPRPRRVDPDYPGGRGLY
jgi:1A family penicillin-binding protein